MDAIKHYQKSNVEKINSLIIESWHLNDGINSFEEILEWISKTNEGTFVDINEISINKSTFWFYDDRSGEILNRKRSFFSVIGMRYFVDDVFVNEQPMIVQPEIGYLGIICKQMQGKLFFLMQAKVEPGNVNCVQISPTVQATKSNFSRVHGGKLPSYFHFFEHAYKHTVIYDQIQSEQASRFYKKRNRNIIILVNDEIELLPNFRWLTLGQIKRLMRIDNLVNMDTRTVLSGLPYLPSEYGFHAGWGGIRYNKGSYFNEALYAVHQYRMFHTVSVEREHLNHLIDWKVDEFGVTCVLPTNFCIRYYDIEISGREVSKWTQPLFKASGKATFGLIYKRSGKDIYFLVHLQPEIGTYDKVEFGPTVQWEANCIVEENVINSLFRHKLDNKSDVILDVLLSEEGGRFFHEENRNVIIDVTGEELAYGMPGSYIWVDYVSLSELILMGCYVNIQLRNLMALLDVDILRGN